jgi:hypothetical protein
MPDEPGQAAPEASFAATVRYTAAVLAGVIFLALLLGWLLARR